MPEKTTRRTHTNTDKEVQRKLRRIAADLGYIADNGPFAGEGNISAMLREIADGNLIVTDTDIYTDLKRRALTEQAA